MIRPFTENDYEAVADIWNATYPDYPVTAAEIRKDDEARPDNIEWRRYVLEHNGPVGFGMFLNSEDTFDPQEFVVTPVVVPEQQGKGYGKALYEHLLRELGVYRPTLLKSWSREDLTRKTRFLQERGFEEKMRSFESRLDVMAFDPAPYAGLEDALKSEGVELKSYADLAADLERDRKIYDLHTTLDSDVPMLGAYTKPTFERFASHHWGDERFLPEAYILAVAGGEYIGLSELSRSQVDATLHTGLTGVLREFRRKGVARAMKFKSIKAAKALSAPEISTWNESNNVGILHINERFGFVKQPASIDFVKKLGDEHV